MPQRSNENQDLSWAGRWLSVYRQWTTRALIVLVPLFIFGLAWGFPGTNSGTPLASAGQLALPAGGALSTVATFDVLQAGNRYFLATSDGVYTSNDLVSWQQFNIGADATKRFPAGRAQALLYDPINQYLYAVHETSGVYRSDPPTLEWTQHGTLGLNAGERTVSVNSFGTSTIYTGTSSGRVFSTDLALRGTTPAPTWGVQGTSPPTAAIQAVVRMGDELFAGTDGGGVSRLDLAATSAAWTQDAGGSLSPTAKVRGLVTTAGRLFAATEDGGVFRRSTATD